MTLLLPEILLSAAAAVLFLLDAPGRVSGSAARISASGAPGVAGPDRGRRSLILGLSAGALIAAAVLALRSPDGAVYGVLMIDDAARFFKVLLLAGVLLVLALSASFEGFQEPGFAWGTFAGLLLLSSVGLLFLVAATDLLMILISVELVSVTSFILTGIVRSDRRSSEAAVKYFLVGAFSTGLMIYGLSLLYGITGTTRAAALLTPGASGLLAGALFFVLAGFGFKLALAPFHMWAPDVYEGAPTPITAFLSVAPKAAAFAMVLRVLPHDGALSLTPLLAVVSAVTMTLGNLAALRQTNVKRLLAYSSIAQMGYALMGFVSVGPAGLRSVAVYLAAYLFMNLGAFACVIAVGADARTETVDGFRGLAGRSLPLALVTTIFLLSLTGIPPLAGFIGKFSLFAAVLQSQGLVWLAVVAAINSVISFAYYFSIVRAMFFGEASRAEPVSLAPAVTGCLGVTLMVTVAAGIFPETLLRLVQRVFP